MHLRYDGQLKTMIKAMTDVVIPSVDSGNELAMEQAQLIVGMLHLMARQLPLQFQFDRDELDRLIETAKDVAQLEDTGENSTLRASIAQASALLAECRVDPEELHHAVRGMREIICAAVDHINAPGRDPVIATRLETIILAMSKQQLIRDRVLLLPQGWELEPDSLPPIEILIASE